VLDKLLAELSRADSRNQFYVFLNDTDELYSLIKKYSPCELIIFKPVLPKGSLLRIVYENIYFRPFIHAYEIDLVYNFTGSRQFFLKIPQLIKVHNLLFYSKDLDTHYFDTNNRFLWFRHIWFKRIVFKFMVGNSEFIEIQSRHVKSYLSDFIDVGEKHFFIKSDVEIKSEYFHATKEYDISRVVKILYIVGPHFEYLHKNLRDFNDAMLALKKIGFDFEIDITLTKSELSASKMWDQSLDSITNFHGYLDQLNGLYQDNTVLISTSVVETLGLHVIDGIKNGVITISPDLHYAKVVYGTDGYRYEIFNSASLVNTILGAVSDVSNIDRRVQAQQKYMVSSEKNKYDSILTVFSEVINVQR